MTRARRADRAWLGRNSRLARRPRDQAPRQHLSGRRYSYMATLVAIGYPDQGTAEQARQTVQQLESELIIQADQVAVDLPRPRGQVPRAHHARWRVRRRRRDVGRLLGTAVRPACSSSRSPAWRSAPGWVRCSATWARRGSTRRSSSRCATTSSRDLGAVHGHRAGDRRTRRSPRSSSTAAPSSRPRCPTRTPSGSRRRCSRRLAHHRRVAAPGRFR